MTIWRIEKMENTIEQQKTKINEAINLMAKDQDIIKIVTDIEAQVKTTKGNYGHYMAFLSNFKNRSMQYIISEAMLKIGADREGIRGALYILKI